VILLSRRECVAVVLTDEEHGQIPHRRQVHCFVESPRICCAVAEIGGCDAICPAQLLPERRSNGERDPTANHPVGSQEPMLQRGELMLARLASAISAYSSQ